MVDLSGKVSVVVVRQLESVCPSPFVNLLPPFRARYPFGGGGPLE
jgi:hypothetical protein